MFGVSVQVWRGSQSYILYMGDERLEENDMCKKVLFEGSALHRSALHR